jgi:phage shock protein A
VFDVGSDPDTIAAGDADGALIAAIQALADRLEDRDAHVERQARTIEQQERRLDEQRADIEALREQLESLQAARSGHQGMNEE